MRDHPPAPDARLRRELAPLLPPGFFERAPGRLGYLAVAAAALAAHLRVAALWRAGVLPAWAWAASGALAALCFPFFLFTLHELGHGAVVRSPRLRRACMAAAGFPLLFQPAFWTEVHTHHHAHANTDDDTDRLRFFDRDEPGGRFLDYRLANPLSLPSAVFAIQIAYGFCLVGFLTGRLGYALSRRRTALAFAAHLAALAGALWLAGPAAALYGYLPVLVAGSALHNMYIVTNHLTRPLTDELDALGTGLSVHLLGASHMGFGRHVEHHLFPRVPHRNLRAVTALLRERHPGRFQELPLPRALARLFTLPGYYRSRRVLTDRRGRLEVPIE